MNIYEELASDIIGEVLDKIEELYPDMKPKDEFLAESVDASILFGVAYYDTESRVANMIENEVEIWNDESKKKDNKRKKRG